MMTPRPATLAMGTDGALDALMTQVCALPLASPLAKVIAGLLDDPQTNWRDLTQAIALDPTLGLRILRSVNSAYFGLPEPVTQVARAIQLIGFDMVREVLDTQSLLCLFTLRPHGRPAIAARIAGLWQHAVATGVAAQALARHSGIADAQAAYTAGLLHDVGKVILLLLHSQIYERCVWAAASEGIMLVAAERKLLDVDHAQLGKRLCLFWGLPDEIAYAIGRHHSVRSGNEHRVSSPLAAIVHVADILARTFGVGWWGDRAMPSLDPNARLLLRLSATDAVALLEAIEAEYAPTLTALNAIFVERTIT